MGTTRKRIRGKSDLAIHGAPPAFPEPLHVGRPNLGSRADFLQRVNTILDQRWLTNDGPQVRELESLNFTADGYSSRFIWGEASKNWPIG